FIQRTRPGDEAEMIEVFNYTFELQSYSFPSGHAMRASILFLFLIYLAVYSFRNIPLKIVLIIIYIGILLLVALICIIMVVQYIYQLLFIAKKTDLKYLRSFFYIYSANLSAKAFT